MLVTENCAAQVEPQQEVRMLVHLAVSDTALCLYGFFDGEERGVFRHLLQVSGIGPSSALALLSNASPAALVTAVLNNDIKSLCAVKGIGKKTAERMVLELRDKLKQFVVADSPSPSISEPVELDLVKVLMQLGFAEVAASKAAQKSCKQLGTNVEFEDLLRLSLSIANQS